MFCLLSSHRNLLVKLIKTVYTASAPPTFLASHDVKRSLLSPPSPATTSSSLKMARYWVTMSNR